MVVVFSTVYFEVGLRTVHSFQYLVVLYNASSGFATSGGVGTIDYSIVSKDMQISAIGAFVAAQEAGKRMKTNGAGAVFLTGATAGVKAFPKRTSFAMGAFALLALAMSMYKELPPAGIHVCHFIIDGVQYATAKQDLIHHTSLRHTCWRWCSRRVRGAGRWNCARRMKIFEVHIMHQSVQLDG